MDEIVNIFIGTEPKTEIARKVLEYSIRKNTEVKLNIKNLMGESWTSDSKLHIGTGFSLLRWSIPEIMDYDLGYAQG